MLNRDIGKDQIIHLLFIIVAKGIKSFVWEQNGGHFGPQCESCDTTNKYHKKERYSRTSNEICEKCPSSFI